MTTFIPQHSDETENYLSQRTAREKSTTFHRSVLYITQVFNERRFLTKKKGNEKLRKITQNKTVVPYYRYYKLSACKNTNITTTG